MPEPAVIDFDELDMVAMSQEETDMDIDVCFPFAPDFPTSTDHRLEGGHNVVYFEIEPGDALGTHKDSPEELVLCLAGDNIEAWSGEKEGTLSAGQMVVIPPMDPHGFRNNGDETARFVGFFSDHTNVSEFVDGELQPMGTPLVKASSS
jgi:quercetin dioxygenase-like cupin family protein